ncbi:hypothetical protein ACJMK2_009177 [Sinanodonta woodiana]|uniref:Fanconi anemia group A protein n=1 Tax=Sinanodonta woodiana TaxID=1069815 RepID=A0ABD3VEE4_SINWO
MTTCGPYKRIPWDLVSQSRKTSRRQPLSENSHGMLWDTVFQLIDYHQDYDGLLIEASSLKRLKNEKDEAKSEDCNSTMFNKNIASLIFGGGNICKSSSDLHLSINCAARILSILPKSGQILDAYSKAEIQNVIHFIKELIMDSNFNQAKFLSLLFKEATLPLELLWILNMEAIVTYSVPYLYINILSVLPSELEHHLFFLNLIAILGTVFNIGFGEKKVNSEETAALNKACVGVLERVYFDVVEHPNDETETYCSWLSRAHSVMEISVETMKRGCVHLLSMMVSHRPEMKVSQAIQQQTEWAYGKIPISMIELFKQMLLPFEVTEVTHLLIQVLENREINWQMFLSLVSVTFVCLPESVKIFTDLIQKLLQDGLEACDTEKTISGLLLARHCCLQGPHVFHSYPEWYQRTFGDSTRSPANSRKTFTFLMKLLTDLVPFEAASHLKAHILRPLYVPSKCRDILSDYIILAKTRLADLKESLNVDGQCGDGSSSDKALEQVEKDVENSVCSFEINGKVSTSVMEASIFKKPYYIGRFLPTLLKPRLLPDVPDTRMKLIEAMRKMEKIPENLYNNYLKACKEETSKLLEGIIIDDDSDDDMSDKLQPPLCQFKNLLEQLTDVILDKNSCHGKTKLKVLELLSLVQEKLDNLSAFEKHEDVSNTIELDPTRTQIDWKNIQVVDIVLNFITRTVPSVYQSSQPQFLWLQQLVSISVQKRGFCRTLYARLWKLLVEQVSSLVEHHIEGLAALCVELYIAQENIPRVRITGREHQPEGSFTQILIQYLQMSTGTQMIFFLRFASLYLQYVFCAIDDPTVDSTNISAVILPDLVKKFAFMCTRCFPELRDLGRMIIHDDAVFPNKEWIFQLYSSKKFQQILQQIKLTFPEWVELEIKVHPEQDLLNVVERFDHYTWAVYTKYLPMEEKDGGCSNDYRLASGQTLEKLINLYTSQHLPVQECARCSEAQSLIRLTNGTEMVSVLQGLVISFHDENNADEDQLKIPTLPWLLDCLRKAVDSQEISTNAKVTAFFRLYMCLPSYLLFMDSLSPHSWVPLSMKRIIDLLNKILIHAENLKHIINRTNGLQKIFDLLEQIDSTFDEVETVFPASYGKDLDVSVISLALFSATLRRYNV